jgi:hypothetical protein
MGLAALLLLVACREETAGIRTFSDEEGGIPLGFLVGSCEIIGRFPDSDRTYSGTLVMSLSESEPASLAITRTIGQVSTMGTGSLAKTAFDGTEVLRVLFREAEELMEATYLVGSDLDNHARLTGYVYKEGGGTTVPGLDVLFSDHYRRP